MPPALVWRFVRPIQSHRFSVVFRTETLQTRKGGSFHRKRRERQNFPGSGGKDGQRFPTCIATRICPAGGWATQNYKVRLIERPGLTTSATDVPPAGAGASRCRQACAGRMPTPQRARRPRYVGGFSAITFFSHTRIGATNWEIIMTAFEQRG